MNKEIKTNRFSVYLIKDRYTEHIKILKNINELELIKIDNNSTLYFCESHKTIPSWINSFFGNIVDGKNKLFNATSKAVLLVELNINNKKKIFAIPFGYGWLLLASGVYEERFGLKTTLNIVDPNCLRKIDKKNMSSIPKDTKEQLSRFGITDDFKIDIEQDLILSITGKAKGEDFGKTITGKDGFNISTKVNSKNIKEFLRKCYERYQSNEYKEYFDWIDQIAEIKDKQLLERLDNQLINNINRSQFDKTWMSIPELIEWDDIKGFSYNRRKGEERKDDINLQDFIESLNESEKGNLTRELIEKKDIYCFSASNNELRHKWKAYNCIYCEINDDNKHKTYLLAGGTWYEIEKDFALQVNVDYQQFRDRKNSFKLPHYNHKDENDYNIKVSENDSNLYCMDRKIINHGGGYSRIEFCDLLSKDKRIIHVKRYGGSSVLSHLFSQGDVSGMLFLSDANFRKKVYQKMGDSHKGIIPENNPKASDYEIVFAIISSVSGKLNIPFFSKITLRNARKRLETYGYRVSLLKILQ